MPFALVAPATAATVVVGNDRGDVELPRLTPDGAVWLSTSGLGVDSVSTRLLHGRPGARVERIATVGGRTVDAVGYGGGTAVTRLAVSGAQIAISTTSYDIAKSKYTGNGTTGANTVLVDLATKVRTEVLECGEFGGGESALSFPWLAYAGCASEQSFTGFPTSSAPILVRDLSRPGTASVQLAPRGADVRAAGTMVGWRTAEALVVHDLARGGEVLRLALPALAGTPADWDLQADGTLAAAFAGTGPQSDATTILWAAPGDPEPKVIVVRRTLPGLLLVGDRLAFERGGGRRELVVRQLAGAERVVARYAPPAPGDVDYGGNRFDFDGSRLVWARAHCATTEIVTRPADEAATDDHGFGICALVFERTATVDRRGRLSARVTCPRLSPRKAGDACSVAATVRLNGRPIASARRRMRAGTYGTLRFAAQPLLLRRRPARLVIRATNRMRGGMLTTRTTIRPGYPARPRR